MAVERSWLGERGARPEPKPKPQPQPPVTVGDAQPEECYHCKGRGWQSIEGTYSYAVRAARNEPHSRRLCEPCGGEGVLVNGHRVQPNE